MKLRSLIKLTNKLFKLPKFKFCICLMSPNLVLNTSSSKQLLEINSKSVDIELI